MEPQKKLKNMRAQNYEALLSTYLVLKTKIEKKKIKKNL